MKVIGFSFIRNAITYDYPVVEAIRSILPLCDEVIVAVGNSDDDTRALVAAIDPAKVRILDTVWDDTLREGGRVLAVETDKALAAVAPDADWAIYIQGDEVLHEQYLPNLRRAMAQYRTDTNVDGLLLNYIHFYGSYRYAGDSRKWYRREIRVIKPAGNVMAYRDAQGFRKKDNTKLRVKLVDAWVYHYGWVKPPDRQKAKIEASAQFWNDDIKMNEVRQRVAGFDYSGIDSLTLFDGTHPAIMQERIGRADWQFDFDIRQKKYSPKNRILMAIQRYTGWRIGEYRNYKLV